MQRPHIGDLLLSEFAKALKLTARDGDFIARLSGDEFAMVVEGLGDIELVHKAFDRVATKVNQTYTMRGVSINQVVSIGVSIYPTDAMTVSELISDADKAMYVSKSDGQGKPHFIGSDSGDELFTFFS